MKQEYSFDQMSEKDILRFWSHAALTANPDKCWEWQKSKSHNGYGQFSFYPERRIPISARAPRVAFFLHNKYIDDTLLVCHTCDNPGCVNPNHLFLGTQKQNMKDCIEKGRFVINCGETRSKKLTNENIFKIKSLFISGKKQYEIAEIFSLHPCHVSRIINNKRWQHLNIN